MPCIKLKIVFEHVSTAINTLPEYYRPKILLFTRLRLENCIIDFLPFQENRFAGCIILQMQANQV
jgi:hypothetical protein